MACFQTITVKANNPSSAKQEALKNLNLDLSLGFEILKQGTNWASTQNTVEEAESFIQKYHQKGSPILSINIKNTHFWVIGGIIKD